MKTSLRSLYTLLLVGLFSAGSLAHAEIIFEDNFDGTQSPSNAIPYASNQRSFSGGVVTEGSFSTSNTLGVGGTSAAVSTFNWDGVGNYLASFETKQVLSYSVADLSDLTFSFDFYSDEVYEVRLVVNTTDPDGVGTREFNFDSVATAANTWTTITATGADFGTSGSYSIPLSDTANTKFVWQVTSVSGNPIASASTLHEWRVDNISINAIPEPGTLALVGLAFAALVIFRRRKAC